MKQKESGNMESKEILKQEEFYTIDPESQEYKDLKEIENMVHEKIKAHLAGEDKDDRSVEKCMKLLDLLNKYRHVKIDTFSVSRFQYPCRIPLKSSVDS